MASRGTSIALIAALTAALAAGACSFDPSASAPDRSAFGLDAGPGGPAPEPTPADASPSVTPDAAPPVAIAGQVLSPRGTPALDGEVEDWQGIPGHAFDLASASHLHLEHPGYRPSAAARFSSMHDDQFIYFLIEVNDDVVSNSEPPLYEDDSVSLYIDARGDRSGPYGADDHEIVIGPGGSYADYTGSDVELVGTASAFDGGWRLEIGVNRASLGGTPGARVLGFSLALTDDDGIGGPAADGYGAWHLRDVAPCPSCCQGWSHAELWCDTRLLGTLELVP